MLTSVLREIFFALLSCCRFEANSCANCMMGWCLLAANFCCCVSTCYIYISINRDIAKCFIVVPEIYGRRLAHANNVLVPNM